MPYKLQILVEKRVSYLATTGIYSIEELREVIEKSQPFLDSVEQDKSAIFISNFSKQTVGPSNFTEIRMESAKLYQHPKYGFTAFYGLGDSIVTTFFVKMLATISREPMHYFRKEEEAIAFIIAKYPDLVESLSQSMKVKSNGQVELP